MVQPLLDPEKYGENCFGGRNAEQLSILPEANAPACNTVISPLVINKSRVYAAPSVRRVSVLIKLAEPVELRIVLISAASRMFSETFILNSPPHIRIKWSTEAQSRTLSRRKKGVYSHMEDGIERS